MSASAATAAMRTTRINVRGQVQGVGFRPFIYRLANELGLNGWVRNAAGGVEIEVQGEEAAVATLLRRIASEAPPLARLDEVKAVAVEARSRHADFTILQSLSGHAQTAIGPDAAICPACLAEILDPAARRYRHPFANCTECGPRYTITRRLPYDRRNTSMAAFAMCPSCRSEYEDPRDRRFHAQPIACPACGPRLWLCDTAGREHSRNVDVIAEALARLLAGQILAIKGIGGFHLMCDARNAESVARLRSRKQREEKPFAVMLAGIASIEPWAECNEAERQLLQARERPIVLLRKGKGCDAAFPGVAPGMGDLGVMLPYAPLHYLLFHEAAGRPPLPPSTAWLDVPQELALVCTSANPGGEPLVVDNDEALAKLAGIADAFLLHDRDIVARCDDSVLRVMQEAGPASPSQFIRRARGYTPRAIKLAHPGRSVLAVGGMLKNTICLTHGDEAFLSQHIGDLDNAGSCAALEEAVAHLMEVLEIEPEIVAHDLHPDFFSSRFAADFARRRGLATLAVQHHHAHIAAVMAEHGLDGLAGPVLGLALDGIGMGSDGMAWGGELLRLEGSRCERLGHLKPLALPGGDRAAREPWRMAASVLHALNRSNEIERRFGQPAAAAVRQMLERNLNAPPTSSCGRLFDAAAGLLGVRAVAAFEGQAAMLLEALAKAHGPVAPMEGGYLIESGVLSLLPLLDRLANLDDPAFGAALFHATLAQGLAEWLTEEAAGREGGREVGAVALGGGCFLNTVLRADLSRRLDRMGIETYHACRVPPNDGGLSLGQAWVGMRELA